MGVQSLSYLGVPIKSGRETIGVLSVQSTTQEDYFDEDSLRLLTTIAANAGSAIHTARLHAETIRRAEEMATLAEIGNDIATTIELQPVLERIAERAKDLLHVRDIAIYLREGDSDTFRAPVALGEYTDEVMAETIPGAGDYWKRGQKGHGRTDQLSGTRSTRVHIPGTPEEEEVLEVMMSAPLISREQVIGMVNVWRLRQLGLFNQADLDFLVSIARQTAIAIESARLYLETQRRASEMAALAEVGRDISATLDLHGAGTDRHPCPGVAECRLQRCLPARCRRPNVFTAVPAVGDIADESHGNHLRAGHHRRHRPQRGGRSGQ